MLKALGLGQAAHHFPAGGGGEAGRPSEDELGKIRKQRDHWRECCTDLNKILNELSQAYAQHKSDFPTARYPAIKAMIKCALEQFHTLCEKQTGVHSEEFMQMMAKYGGCGQNGAQSGDVTDGAKVKASAPSLSRAKTPSQRKRRIGEMLASLKALASKTSSIDSHIASPSSDATNSVAAGPVSSKMSPGGELRELRKETLRMKEEWRRKRQRLEMLETEYKKAKQQRNIHQRYVTLKLAVKATVADLDHSTISEL